MTTDNNANIALTRLNLTKNLLADTTPSKIYDNYKLQVIHCLRLRPRPTGAKEAMPGPLNPYPNSSPNPNPNHNPNPNPNPNP